MEGKLTAIAKKKKKKKLYEVKLVSIMLVNNIFQKVAVSRM